jgi:twitching motility two-component system response regulator PilH
MANALVIDDNPEISEDFCKMLNLLGLEARPALSVREAMLILREFVPQIVFLDIKMPGFDGFEVFSYILREPLLEKVPVCIVSSENQEETVRRAKKMGAIGFIVKPAMVEDFEKILRKAKLVNEK